MRWKTAEVNSKTNYDKAGIYKILLVEKNGNPVRIRRLGGIDEEGVLVIGCSEHIDTRRRQFITSSTGRHGHSEGIQWWLVKHFSQLAEQTSLRFAFAEFRSKEHATRAEMQEIQNYFTKYLEAPPLNGVIPRRVEWFNRLRAQ